MCIIVNKEVGMELPRKEILENCYDYNPDGCGFMYNKDGKVYIEKGFMKFPDFYNRLIKLDKMIGLKERGLVMHFRISTSGKVDRGNCHPYPLSKNEKDLRKLKFTTDLGVAHNGIISKYIPAKNSILNDTQLFIKEYLVEMHECYRDFLSNKIAMQLVEKEVGSKLSFLDAEGNITTVGSFEEYEGCFYSNSTYKNSYSSSYWSKWSFNTSYPSEYDAVDLAMMANKPLDLETFTEVLEVLDYPKDGDVIVLDNGKEIIANGYYAIDDLDSVYEIDYISYCITYLGYKWDIYDANEFLNYKGY